MTADACLSPGGHRPPADRLRTAVTWVAGGCSLELTHSLDVACTSIPVSIVYACIQCTQHCMGTLPRAARAAGDPGDGEGPGHDAAAAAPAGGGAVRARAVLCRGGLGVLCRGGVGVETRGPGAASAICLRQHAVARQGQAWRARGAGGRRTSMWWTWRRRSPSGGGAPRSCTRSCRRARRPWRCAPGRGPTLCCFCVLLVLAPWSSDVDPACLSAGWKTQPAVSQVCGQLCRCWSGRQPRRTYGRQPRAPRSTP